MRNLRNQLKHFNETSNKIEKLQREQFQLAAVILKTSQNPDQVKDLTQQELEYLSNLREYYKQSLM